VKFISKLTNESVVCSELKVKDYKEILKCTLGDEPNQNIFVETVCEVLEHTTNKTADFFKNLSVINLFILLLDLRINSQGDTCKVVVTKDEKQMNLELRLDYIRDEVLDLSKQFLNSTVQQNSLEVGFECPSLSRLTEQTEEEYLYFIKNFKSKKLVEVKSNEQARALFDKLPAKVSLEIIKKFEQFVKGFSKHNFLSRYSITDQQLAFLPSLSSLIWFVKLLFNEPLDVFYDNLFYLSHLGHLNAQYVEQCSVGEYMLFVSQLKRTVSSKSEQPPEEQMIPDDEDEFSGQFEEEI
jgi:hypothetical protein